ncbi:MAG: TldD/PmbA family protein [Bacteroidales bacterium]|nr:TldD/PmbA family protein [Bacteroidales bacterium]
MGILEPKEMALARFCLDAALRKGAQKARIALSKSTMDLVGTLNGEIDKVTRCLDRSLSVVLFVDGRFGSFSLNRLEEAEIEAFLDRAVATVRLLAPDRFRDLAAPERTAKNAAGGRELDLCDPAYETMTPDRRLSLALGASLFKGCDPGGGVRLVSEEAEYSDSLVDSYLIDSNSLECRHTETAFEYGVEMTVADAEGTKYSGYWWDSAVALQDLDLASCCPTALRKACAQVGPKRRRSGRYRIVVDSSVASRLVTPVLSALSAYAIQQENSFLAGRAGQKVFPEGMTLVDDCHIPGQSGSRLFDSEGVATRPHTIIGAGTVEEYFVNTYMAGKMGIPPTVEDATRPRLLPWPHPGQSQQDLLARCGDGILITGFNGGNSNSSTGDFSYGIEGFAFKGGKITHPVKEMLLTGNFISLWNSLLAVADDARPCMSKLIPTLAFDKADLSG